MAFPAGWDLVNITGTYVGRNGVPCVGTVTFSSPQMVLRSGTIVPAADIVFTLDANGSFSGQIPATDDPNANPSGWVYTVTENVPGGRQGYQILAPHTSPGIDLSTVVPVTMPVPAVFPSPYATLAQLASETAPVGASLVGYAAGKTVADALASAAGGVTLAQLAATSAPTGASLVGYAPGKTVSDAITATPTLTQLAATTAPTGASLIGFLQPLAGAVGRTLQTWGQDRISVKDFGAVGDGVALDDAAFAAALAALQTNSTSRGGILYIPRGTYKLSQTLTLTSYSLLCNMTLQGDGQNATLLDWAGSAANIDGIDVQAGTQFWIRDLTVANCTGIGINIGAGNTVGGANYCDRFAVERVRIQGCSSDGLRCINAYLGTFSDIWSEANGGNGFNFAGYHTSISVQRCEASNNTGWGYALNGMVYSAFIACGSDGNGQDGYAASNCVGVAFVGCGAESNQKRGWNFFGAATTGLVVEAYGVHAVTLQSCCAFFSSKAGAGLYAAVALSPDFNGADVSVSGMEIATTSASDVAFSVAGAAGAATLRLGGILRATAMGSDVVSGGGVIVNVDAQGATSTVTMTADQSIPTGVNTNVTLGQINANTAGFSLSAGNLIVPANVYAIRVDIGFGFAANATGVRQISLLHNGTSAYPFSGVNMLAASAGSTNGTCSSGVIAVSPGDTLTLVAYQNSGAAINLVKGGTNTYVSVTVVG